MRNAAFSCLCLGAALLSILGASCSLGDGDGEVKSDKLRLENCWDGPYNMEPSFFAGVPYRSTFSIRVQRGGDLAEVSDGLSVLVDDVHQIRGDSGESLIGKKLDVGLSPEVTPPGIPVTPLDNPPLVHMALYLNNSCHDNNSILYVTRGTITFSSLFNGDQNTTDADDKLTAAEFDVMVGDPRDQPSSGGPIPDDKLSHVTGWFRFYFQRGKPGQPFP